jgi:hypothetical protein
LWDLLEAELIVNKRRDLVVEGYAFRKLCLVENGFAAGYKLLRNGKRQIVNLVLPGDVVVAALFVILAPSNTQTGDLV